MPTAAAQVHIHPRQQTVDEWDRHARDYYNGMKQRKRISLKNEREIDSMFEKLDLARTPQEKQKMRVELWKTINLAWVSTSTHHLKKKEGFLFRDENWEKNVREKYTLLTKKVASEVDTEKLWMEQMREHIIASNRILSGTTSYVEGYNERIETKRGLSGIVIKMGTALFGIEPKPLDPLVFHQSISPGVEDYEELRKLEAQIDQRIRAAVEVAVKDEIRNMPPKDLKVFRALSPKARDEEINRLRKAHRNVLLWKEMQNELKNPELLDVFYRATFDSHFGATLGTTARGPSPSPAKRSNIDRFADALMNFPDPFKNFTYRNIMDWIDEKIK